MHELPDVEVGVLTDRPDLDMLISIWVQGYVATRVRDVDAALDVVARDGVLLIDLGGRSQRPVVDALRDRGFEGPAVLFGGSGDEEALDPGDRIVSLRALSFSTMGQMLTLTQAFAIAREGRVNEEAVLDRIHADEPVEAVAAESTDEVPWAMDEGDGLSEPSADHPPVRDGSEGEVGEPAHPRLWSRVRSLFGQHETSDPQLAEETPHEPPIHVSLLRERELGDDLLFETPTEDDTSGRDRSLTSPDADAVAGAETRSEEHFSLQEGETAADLVGRPETETSSLGEPDSEDLRALVADEEVWEPLPVPADSARMSVPGQAEWDEAADIGRAEDEAPVGPLATGEPTLGEPVRGVTLAPDDVTVEPSSPDDPDIEPPDEAPASPAKPDPTPAAVDRAPSQPLPFVDSDESGRAWILLDRIDPVVLDGGAMVMVLDDRDRLAPIAATGLAPFEGAVTLPIDHPLAVAAVRSGPVQLTKGHLLPVDDVPLSDCSVLVAIADKLEPRLLLIGSSRPFDEEDTDRIVAAFEDRGSLQNGLSRVRPPVGRELPRTDGSAVWPTEDEEQEDAPDATPSVQLDAPDLDPFEPPPWRILNEADGRAELGLGSSSAGAGRIVGDLAVAAWQLLNDLHHLTDGGGALIALRGTSGWYIPVAAFRCQPLDAARSIPPGHPLLQRLRAEGGTVTVVNEPPVPSIASGLPLSFRAAVMVFALGAPDDPTCLALIGRSRRPSVEEVADVASALRDGRRPAGGWA